MEPGFAQYWNEMQPLTYLEAATLTCLGCNGGSSGRGTEEEAGSLPASPDTQKSAESVDSASTCNPSLDTLGGCVNLRAAPMGLDPSVR